MFDALIWVIETYNVEPTGSALKALHKHNLVAVQEPIHPFN